MARRMWLDVLCVVVGWLSAAVALVVFCLLSEPAVIRFDWFNAIPALAIMLIVPLVLIIVGSVWQMVLEIGEPGPDGKDIDRLLKAKRHGRLMTSGEQPPRRVKNATPRVPDDRGPGNGNSRPAD